MYIKFCLGQCISASAKSWFEAGCGKNGCHGRGQDRIVTVTFHSSSPTHPQCPGHVCIPREVGMGAGGKGILLMRKGTRFPFRSLTSQISFLLDTKSRAAHGQLGPGDGSPPPGRSPAQHPLTAEDVGRCPPPRAGGLADRAPEVPWPNKWRTSTSCKALSPRPCLL